MKLSLTLHEKTYSIDSDESFDGTNLNELVEQFKGLLVNAGFHPSNVDDMFNTEYQWFTQEERDENMQGHLKGDANPFMDAFKKGYEAKEFQENMYQDPQEKAYQEKLNKIKDNE